MNMFDILYSLYMIFSFYMFFQFCVGNLNFGIYNKKTDEYLELSNWISFILISMFSLAWPLTLYYIYRDKED